LACEGLNMNDIKVSLHKVLTIIIVTLIFSGLWVLDARCSTLDNDLSSGITSESTNTAEKEANNAEQKQSAIEENFLRSGQEMFQSGNFVEARKAFDNVLKLNSKNVQAQYFLGLVEYEEGNIEKAKIRFQIAHECLGLPSESKPLQIGAKQAQLQFPDNYQARIYYKDGWYIRPKSSSDINTNLLSLDSGSDYKIELKSNHTKSWLISGVVGSVVLLSFFLAR
jgi:tetratricopeptide (TPR) repeat protein